MFLMVLYCGEFSFLVETTDRINLTEITPEKKPLQSRTKKLNPIFMIGLSDEEELISSPENHKASKDGPNSEKKPPVQRLRKTIQSSTGSESTNVEKIFEDNSKASICIIKCKPPIPSALKLQHLTSDEDSFCERKEAVESAVRPSKALDTLSSLNCSMKSGKASDDTPKPLKPLRTLNTLNGSKSGKPLRLLDSLSSDDTLKPSKSLRTLSSLKMEEPLEVVEKNLKKLPEAIKEEEPNRRIDCEDKDTVVRLSPKTERDTASNKTMPMVTKPPPEESSAVGDEESGGSITKSGYCVKFEPGLNDYLSELAQSHHFQTSINEVKDL